MRFSSARMFELFLLLISVHAAAESFATFRSEDGGRSWRASSAGLPEMARVNGFGQSANVVLAATEDGVFVSQDEGRTWQPSAGTNLAAARPLCLIASRSRVFLGTERAGVLASRDSGATWAPVNRGLKAKTIRCLLTADGVIFAGTDRDGVFRSNDGTNWRNFSEGLPAGGQAHQFASSGRAIFAALYQKGLYRRRLDDDVWRKVGEVTPLAITVAENHVIVGHNPGGIHWSDDGGSHWFAAGSQDRPFDFSHGKDGALSRKAPVWALASNGKRAFAGAEDGIFFSDDQGRAWTRAAAGLPSTSPAVAFLATERFVLATIVQK